jgi:hypothetical protein
MGRGRIASSGIVVFPRETAQELCKFSKLHFTPISTEHNIMGDELSGHANFSFSPFILEKHEKSGKKLFAEQREGIFYMFILLVFTPSTPPRLCLRKRWSGKVFISAVRSKVVNISCWIKYDEHCTSWLVDEVCSGEVDRGEWLSGERMSILIREEESRLQQFPFRAQLLLVSGARPRDKFVI